MKLFIVYGAVNTCTLSTLLFFFFLRERTRRLYILKKKLHILFRRPHARNVDVFFLCIVLRRADFNYAKKRTCSSSEERLSGLDGAEWQSFIRSQVAQHGAITRSYV